MHIDRPLILLSGGSSGIGMAISQYFANKQWEVIEISRHENTIPNVRHIPCDISNEQEVHQVLKEISNEVAHIDVLVCNAGVGIAGAIEFSSNDNVREQMEVNFIGTLNLVKATLPFMRQQKYGKILFTSSLASIFPIPFQAFYSASKSSLNALAYALSNEVKPFNIHISVILLGDVNTNFTLNRRTDNTGKEIYPLMQKAIKTMENDERNGMNPETIAKYFYKVSTKKHPKITYVCGIQYKILYLLYHLLPNTLVMNIISRLYCH